MKSRDSKLVKAYCAKSKQYYALEVKKFGAKWKVVNMTFMSKEEGSLVSSEIKQDRFETNVNLLACTKCGSRVVGDCSCPSKKQSCKQGMKYNFQCIYCKNFVIDYSLPTAVSGRKEGETVTLAQGQEVKIKFADDSPLTNILVGVGWDEVSNGLDMDVDSSVVLLHKGQTADDNEDLVYFSNKEHPSKSVIHHGDNLTGRGKPQEDDERISVNLQKVPATIDRLVFVLNIYKSEERHQNLSNVKNLYIKLKDSKSKKVLIEYKVFDNMSKDNAIVIGVAKRSGDGWSFKAIGKSLKCNSVHGLARVCHKYI